MAEGSSQGPGPSKPPKTPDDDARTSQRVFKKTSSNNKITLYIARRDLVLEPNRVERVEGVLLIDPEYVENRDIYGQIIAIFRYGREDEEIMGLQFFSENIENMVRIWPTCPQRSNVTLSSPLQETLVRRLGPNAIPFHMELFDTAQPSVVLVPTKPYHGQPVGTSYDVRIIMNEEPGDMVHRPVIVRMGIRVTHGASRIDTAPLLTPSPSRESFRVKPRYQRLKVQCRPKVPVAEDTSDPITEDEYAPIENEIVEDIENGDQGINQSNGVKKEVTREERSDTERSENVWGSNKTEERSDSIEEIQGNEEVSVVTESAVPVGPRPSPRVTVEKSFLLSDGKVRLESWLDKSSYHHGDKVVVNFHIVNDSLKTVSRIKAYAIQYVNVCMFDNGKFKNVVAMAKDSSYSVLPGQRFHDYFGIKPSPVIMKNWIALEANVSNAEDCLASTVVYQSKDAKRRGMPSLFVSYYVKLTLFMNKFGGELSLKLPFSLSHAPPQDSLTDSTTEESANRTYMEEEGCSAEDNGDSDDKNNKKSDGEEPDREKANNEEDDGNINDTKEDVNNGNALITDDTKEDVNNGKDIIENQLAEGSHFEGLPLVSAAKPDEQDFSLARYLETNI